jgi:hypothetical protein
MRRLARTAKVVLVLTMLALAVPAVGVGAAGASAPAGTEEEATTYVGIVKGVGSLGLVVDDDGAFAYLCDSEDVTSWFKGSNDGGKLDLQAPDGSVIAAGVKGRNVDGVFVSADGTATDFVLKQATGNAGLFRQEQVIDGTGYAAGWVALPDGTIDGQVSTANLAGARVLLPQGVPPVTNEGVKVEPTGVVGLPAPPAVKAVFPTTPPPADEVVVVPFTTGNQQTDQAPGGGGTGATEPGGVTTTTAVAQCKDAGEIRDQIASLTQSLDDAGLLKRRAIKQQIERLRAELKDAERGLNCTLPLK